MKCKITIDKKEDAEMDSIGKSMAEKMKEEKNEDDCQGDKTDIVNEITAKYPFDLDRKEVLDYIYEMKELKARLYVIQCQNLTAVDSYSDWKSTLAGYSANCSANPYIVAQVGSGKNTEGLIRYIEDEKNVIPSNLNPKFKSTFPLDCIFPEDNIIRIETWSKARILRDALIGFTQFDLEDRYYGDPYNQALIGINLYKKYYEDKLKEQKPQSEKFKHCKKNLTEINRLLTQIETFEHKNPIEYRQLMVSGKSQPQGTIQMWLDIFPADSRFPEYNLKVMGINKYEIRLIIWDTYSVPKSDGVKIYFHLVLEKSGGSLCNSNIRK